jgi:hypothetical protein
MTSRPGDPVPNDLAAVPPNAIAAKYDPLRGVKGDAQVTAQFVDS